MKRLRGKQGHTSGCSGTADPHHVEVRGPQGLGVLHNGEDLALAQWGPVGVGQLPQLVLRQQRQPPLVEPESSQVPQQRHVHWECDAKVSHDALF